MSEGPGVPVPPPVTTYTCAPSGGFCRDTYTITSPTDGRGPVTLADLINFRPQTGIASMEPNGWAVIGLPTNFFVTTGAHVQNGVLLDTPAAVRFTPVGYSWDYGDGSTARTAVPGASWDALGVGEFSDTATSHIFRTVGDYRVTVTVDFRAEYSFGSPDWIPIDGTLPQQVTPMTITATTADTVLVGRDCITAPRGPGC